MKRYNRPKGTVETFEEIATLYDGNLQNMVAEVSANEPVCIFEQAFDSADKRLRYQVSFKEVGRAIVRVTSFFDAGEKLPALIEFRSTSDGTSTGTPDYV